MRFPSLFLFLFLCILPSLHAKTFHWYLNEPSRSNLPIEIQRNWARSVLGHEPKLQTHKTEDMELIEKAELSYLNQDFEELDQQIRTLEKSLESELPHTKSYEIFERLYELSVLKEYSHAGGFSDELIDRLQFFLMKEDFLKRLPESIQNKKRDPLPFEAPYKTKFILIYGQAFKSDKLPAGKYLVHLWEPPHMQTAWMHIKQNNVDFKVIKTQNLLLHMPPAQLQSLLKAHRPGSTLQDDIFIYVSSQTKFHLPARSNLVNAPTEQNLNSNLDLQALMKDEEPEVKRKTSILSSPWFWLAVGVAAFGGGYLIYESTKSPREVHTP